MRKIIHVDMDAFFAAVEQRDHPELRGKPVIVGGPPDSRSVVATCSYEARKYGVRSAMPSGRAKKLCPEAIFVKGRFSAYREASEHIRAIFREYTDLVEPLSLDEAYLDVTENKKDQPYASKIAREILNRIEKELQLTASAGVGTNKFVAKVASDYQKPSGLTIVRPEHMQNFIDVLPVAKIYGVGRATEKKMLQMNLHYAKDLRLLGADQLWKFFGKAGLFYYSLVTGQDERKVKTHRDRKSLGLERTFKRDLMHSREHQEMIKKLSGQLSDVIIKKNLTPRALTLKLRYPNFETVTRACSSNQPIRDKNQMVTLASQLMRKSEAAQRGLRLLGLSVSRFDRRLDNNQLMLL